jgi:hypothetical protein
MPFTDDAEGDEPQGDRFVDDEWETRHERLNRELDQLLNELRVVLPGVQVLLAFLLTAVFATGFDRMDDDGRAVYLTAVVLTALATIFLMAPTMHHRLRFREGVKEQMIRTVNRLTIAGMSMLGVAIGCVLYVVGDVGFSETVARWLGPALIVVTAVVWFVVPLRYREGGAVVKRHRRDIQSDRADRP